MKSDLRSGAVAPAAALQHYSRAKHSGNASRLAAVRGRSSASPRRTVLLVDNGTAGLAINAVRALNPSRIASAVPARLADAIHALRRWPMK